MSLKLFSNSNIMVIGSTNTGKTTMILKLIKEQLIEPMPKKIFYLYGARQSFMDTWNKDATNPQIEFVEGLNLDVINSYKNPKLLVIDDLMLDMSKDLSNHFIAGSHHKLTTTIFVTHSIFLNNDNYRLISNNCQCISF